MRFLLLSLIFIISCGQDSGTKSAPQPSIPNPSKPPVTIEPVEIPRDPRVNPDDVKTMIQLAQHYPLFVKALLGAIVQEMQKEVIIDPLFQKLNPLTFYKIGVKKGDLKYQKNWKIR